MNNPAKVTIAALIISLIGGYALWNAEHEKSIIASRTEQNTALLNSVRQESTVSPSTASSEETRLKSKPPESTKASFGADSQERTTRFQNEIERIYGDALSTLNLPQPQLEKVKYLFVERLEAAADAQTVVTADHTSSVRSLIQTREITEAKIDAELRATVDETFYNKIKHFLEAQVELSTIEVIYQPAFAQAGAPLSPIQKVALADVLHEIYNPGRNPDYKKMRDRAIDPITGLSVLDRTALVQVTGVLSRPQKKIFANQLAEKTKIVAPVLK
jgi:hypothetical protein